MFIDTTMGTIATTMRRQQTLTLGTVMNTAMRLLSTLTTMCPTSIIGMTTEGGVQDGAQVETPAPTTLMPMFSKTLVV